MSKRLTDTGIWSKKWFRTLPPEYKLLWFYMKDTCNNIGVWDVDLDLAATFIGKTLKEDEVLKVFGPRLCKMDDCHWLLTGYVKFHYGLPLSETNKWHLSVKSLLDKAGIQIVGDTLSYTLPHREGDTLPHTPINNIINYTKENVSYKTQEEISKELIENKKNLVEEILMSDLPEAIDVLKEKYKELPQSDLNALLLSKYIYNIVSKKFPDYKSIREAKVKTWMKDADLLLRVDKVDAKLASKVFKFASGDSFWTSIVRSPDNLRKNFDKIRAKMDQPQQVDTEKKVTPPKKQDWTNINGQV